ncbi:MAG: GNAT family N-acetyltransferase [Candidatus Pacebacteria bacterium]|nr:GNAT family N-acetyltransferase [Candidatus Paceibacterota bacterium]
MIIKRKRILLKLATESDFPLFQKWFSLENMKYMISHMPQDIKYNKEMCLEIYSKKNLLVFIIETNEKPIGSCGLKNIDPKKGKATFGIKIEEEEDRNKGYGTEAAQLLFDYGFKKLKLHQIDSAVSGLNIRSIRMHEKLGFNMAPPTKDENGKFRDDVYFTLSKKDWEEKQKEL